MCLLFIIGKDYIDFVKSEIVIRDLRVQTGGNALNVLKLPISIVFRLF